jgi:hypothetical protein
MGPGRSAASAIALRDSLAGDFGLAGRSDGSPIFDSLATILRAVCRMWRQVAPSYPSDDVLEQGVEFRIVTPILDNVTTLVNVLPRLPERARQIRVGHEEFDCQDVGGQASTFCTHASGIAGPHGLGHEPIGLAEQAGNRPEEIGERRGLKCGPPPAHPILQPPHRAIPWLHGTAPKLIPVGWIDARELAQAAVG